MIDEKQKKKLTKSRIPTFKSIEAAAEFWDTHSTTEFEDEWEEVTEDIRFVVVEEGPKKAVTVRIPEKTFATLAQQARESGITPSTLAGLLIIERLWELEKKKGESK